MPITPQCLAKGNRFSSTNQPKKNGCPPGPRLTTILSKLLSAKWDFNDPKIKALIKKQGLEETIETALVLRRILNGTEGDDTAIERIFDRLDGKVIQKVSGEGGKVVVIIHNAGDRQGNRTSVLSALPSADDKR